MTPEETRTRKEDQAVQLKGLDLVDKVGQETEAIADGVTVLVGVLDEHLKGLAGALGAVETIKGRDGDPGPKGDPGPPGESIKGDPGAPGAAGSAAPRPVAVVAERDFRRRLTGAKQLFADGTAVHFDARRDADGHIAEFVRDTPAERAKHERCPATACQGRGGRRPRRREPATALARRRGLPVPRNCWPTIPRSSATRWPA